MLQLQKLRDDDDEIATIATITSVAVPTTAVATNGTQDFMSQRALF